MRSNSFDVRNIAITAVMIALVMLGVMAVRIPTPIGGFAHLGDILIYFAAFAFGPFVGLIAGGVGAALADVLSGFAVFAILSLIVHGVQGYVAGRIAHGTTSIPRLLIAVVVGGIIVVAGYYIGEVILFGFIQPDPNNPGTLAFGAYLAEVPANTIQVIVGALGAALYLAVRRAYPPLVRSRSAA
jgi:uncharacterized membrane protein